MIENKFLGIIIIYRVRLSIIRTIKYGILNYILHKHVILNWIKKKRRRNIEQQTQTIFVIFNLQGTVVTYI